MMRRVSFAAMVLTLALSGTSDANLIVNGGFENYSIPVNGYAQYAIPNASDAGVDAWYNPKTGNLIEIQTNSVLGGGRIANSGKNYAELNPTQATQLAQDVQVVAGQSYLLSFFYAARPGTPQNDANLAGVQTANVYFAGSLLNTSPTLSQFPGDGAILWTPFTKVVTATSTGTATLLFDALTPPGSYGMLIDDVSLSAVPEPASVAMSGFALMSVSAVIWRRRKARVAQA